MYFYLIVHGIMTVGFSQPIGSDVCNYSFFLLLILRDIYFIVYTLFRYNTLISC